MDIMRILKQLGSFIRHPPAIYGCFYIYEHTLDSDTPSTPSKVEGLTLRKITQAVELEDLSVDSRDIAGYRGLLDKGGIVFCAFVGTELAHTSGIALSREAHNSRMGAAFVPYGYATLMAVSRTAEKYQRNGIHSYVQSEVYRYLVDRGASKVVTTINKKAIAAQNAQIKLGSQFIGTVHMVTRVFRVIRLSRLTQYRIKEWSLNHIRID